MLNLNITKITPHNNFTIDIYLSNSTSFQFDIKPYLKGEGLKKLRQLNFFNQAKFKEDVIYWDKDHDFPLHCMDIPKNILSNKNS